MAGTQDNDPRNLHDVAVDAQTDIQKLAVGLAHAGASPQAVAQLTKMGTILSQVVKVLAEGPSLDNSQGPPQPGAPTPGTPPPGAGAPPAGPGQVGPPAPGPAAPVPQHAMHAAAHSLHAAMVASAQQRNAQ